MQRNTLMACAAALFLATGSAAHAACDEVVFSDGRRHPVVGEDDDVDPVARLPRPVDGRLDERLGASDRLRDRILVPDVVVQEPVQVRRVEEGEPEIGIERERLAQLLEARRKRRLPAPRLVSDPAILKVVDDRLDSRIECARRVDVSLLADVEPGEEARRPLRSIVASSPGIRSNA